MRQGEDFSYAQPAKEQSDPGGVETPRSSQYPRHVHKWNAETAPLNDWKEARTAEEHQRLLGEGWFDDIQTEPPEAEADAGEPTAGAPGKRRR